MSCEVAAYAEQSSSKLAVIFSRFITATAHVDGWQYRRDASWRSSGFEQDDRHAVVCVSWGDAKELAAYISSIADKPYRLLTEAERESWLAPARRRHFGGVPRFQTAQANYRGDDVWRG
jgi:formylglycine-generating enzyme required for sulfatase activity